MENEITAHKAGKIAELPISEGDAVTAGDTLAVINEWLTCFDEARRLAADPVDLGRRARRGGAARTPPSGRSQRVRRAGGTAELGRHARRRAAGRRRAALGARERADGDDLRPLRRAGPGRSGATGRRRRSSPRSATAACTPAARPTTRATSSRCCTSPARWRQAGELPVHVRVLIEGAEETGSDDVGEWVAPGRARRGRGDRLRQRHGRRRHARADARDARDGVRARRGPHGHAARALGHVRRRRAERLPRAAPGAVPRSCPGPTAGCPEPLRAGVKPPSRARDRGLGDAARRRVRARPGRRAAVRPGRRDRVLRAHDGRAVAGRPPRRGRPGAHDRRARGQRRPVGADRRRPALGGDRRATSSSCCATRCPTAPS